MPKNLADLKLYLTRIKPWAVVAAVLTAALLGYYGLQGWRYWESAQFAQSLSSQKAVLEKTMREKLRGREVLAAELNVERGEMERLEQMFHHPQADELIGIVANAARQNRVALSSVSTGDGNMLVSGEMQYQVQPMTLVLEGQQQDVYSYLAAIHQSLPTVRFDTVRVSAGEAGRTLANLQLSFLLSPQLVEAEDAAKGKASSSKSTAAKDAK